MIEFTLSKQEKVHKIYKSNWTQELDNFVAIVVQGCMQVVFAFLGACVLCCYVSGGVATLSKRQTQLYQQAKGAINNRPGWLELAGIDRGVRK